MAKTSKIVKNEMRKVMANKYFAKRMELKKIIRNPNTSFEDRMAAFDKLRKIPRDANPNRIMNRCRVTGRTRAVYRKFGLSRISLREMASQGLIPGVIKASW
ncbi:MAG: 30S ribosomal protein S14 [Kiritimatiellales bacterium]